ncbi:asparaginase domain-containing protein [Herbaspirillum sp. VT-16-41]|uniref:asparaginase domain-containing protein n=1 Tax=Herbaspirillum sp. VT-16-41 TaxID=1953765 RepID=UPI0009815CF3|nr:asparaginase domain-containing protein [Herbaspirillum sp. VT-16-41]ONN65815.1 L-asparaginase [Herbaspirillum sp. VT-16-41]
MSGLSRASGKPRVAVIGTGGTFAMHARHAFDWVEYSESGVVHPIGDLVEQLDRIDLDIEILPQSFRMIGSTGILPQDWMELAQLIRRTVQDDPGLTGIVVTHGTATMEETAWFLQLATDIRQPIVLTGAQRPLNTSGSDAMANLRAALAVAAAPQAQGQGVLVVMDGMVFAARDVSKAASFELHAFEATPYGPLGRVDADGSVVLRRRVTSSISHSMLPALDMSSSRTLPRVDMVVSYAGADGAAIDGVLAAGARGIISIGLAPGRPANGERAALQRAVAQGVVVVQAARAARGVVPPQAFLQRDGVLAGGDLAAPKLRILLMLILAQSPLPDAAAIQALLLAH